MNYKMVRAEDGIVWVSIQPLMNQVKQHLEEAKKIDITNMCVDDKKGIDFTILSIEAVYNFLNSLLTEQNLTELLEKEENKKNEILH